MRRTNAHWILRYGIAVASVGVATWVRLLLDPVLGDRLPFEVLFIAIMFTAWSTGAGPSLLSVVLSIFAVKFFILPPRWSLAVVQPEYRAGLMVFGFVGFFSVMIAEAMHEERRRAERAQEALRESEARCRSVIESNIVGIGFWRADGTIIDANDALLAMLGCTREEVASGGLHFPDFTPPEYREIDERAMAEIAANGSCAPFEKEYITRDGRRTPVVVGGAHFPHDRTRGPFFALDIGDHKGAERALREAGATLRSFYETSPLMMGVVEVADDDIRHLTDNAATGRFFGADPTAITGRWASELGVPPDHIREWVARYRESERTGEPVRFGYPHGTPGGIRWISAIVYCIERLPGGRCRCSYVAEDATERRRVEEALGRQSERLRLLWEAATVLLTAEDPDAMLHGLFERIAPQFGLDAYFNFLMDESGDGLHLCSCAGIPEEEVRKIARLELGQAVCGTVALRRRPIVATRIQDSDEPMTALVKGYGIRAYACNPLLVDGRLLGTLSFASRRRDEFEPDELEFLRTICHYVTVAYERWRLVRELRDQDRRKDEFLATLAHELRNPLAPVRNALAIARMPGADSETLERSQEMMERQVHHLVRLVDDLLDVSRVMRGRIELRKERVDLATVVARAVETAQPLIDAQGHELSVDLPEGPLPLEADPVRLAQVVGNLLANAAKYTEPGGRIGISARRDGDAAILEVRDTGIGLAPEMIARIFDLFVQADHSSERSQGGLGIGLTLARSLVEMHQGTIQARSAGPGRGSTFVVRLPLAPPVATANGRTDAGPSRGTAASSAARRLLVVDDNRDSADSLGMLLRLQGHEVRVAYDGASALAIAPEYRPEIAFLDIGMPGMDGHELARRLRGLDADGLVLVALTGWGTPEDRRRSAEAGFDHHLVKPLDLAALAKLLARVAAV